MAASCRLPLALASLSLLSLGPASQALADDASADALLRQGVELRRKHDNDGALKAFTRAWELMPSATARAQVGLAEQALGQWVEAERDVEEALARGDDPWVESHRAALEGARDEIRKHLAWLTVEVDVAGAEVRLDGKSVAPRAEQRVVAGAVTLDVGAEGFSPESRTVALEPGAHERVAVTLVRLVTERPEPRVEPSPASQERPEASPPLTAHSSPWVPGPLILMGVGAFESGVGVYFGIRTLDAKQARDAHCPGGSCSPAAVTDDADARYAASLSTAALVAGGASVVGAATWALVDARRADRLAPGSPPRSAGPFVLGALGVASAGVGTYFGLHALSEKSARDQQCTPVGCTPAAFATDAEARAAADIATVAIGSGVALLATAAVLWLRQPPAERSSSAVLGGLRAVPVLGWRTAGVSVEGVLR